MTIGKSRREILKHMGAARVISSTPAIADGKHTNWQIAAPGGAGFKSDPVKRFDDLAKSGRLAGLHRVAALRGGRIVFERYIDGNDMKLGAAARECQIRAGHAPRYQVRHEKHHRSTPRHRACRGARARA